MGAETRPYPLVDLAVYVRFGVIVLERSRRIPPPEPSRATPGFDRAAIRLMAAAQGSNHALGEEVTGEDYRVVASALERFAKGFRLSGDDAEEVVASVLAEMLGRTRADRDVRHPGAYLFWTTRNRVLDRLRQESRHPTESLDSESLDRGLGWYSDEDDAIARLLERRATTEMIDAALRAAAAADDQVAVRVVAVWLELAEELGREPTSREVAPEADTSHTTVSNALRRFKTYLRPGVESSPS